MKKILLLVITFLGIGITNAQIVNIPDANFKAYLVGNTAINTNGDTEIQVSEASAFTGQIDCPFQNISDLTGIEAFTNVYYIVCSFNNLTALDFSANTALEVLYCQNNNLTSLNISSNSLLRVLSCHNNNLTSIDVSNNSALTNLDCQANNLSTLDVSLNSSLHGMNFRDNSLSSLNVANGNNTNYSYFAADNNPNLNCIEVDDSTFCANNWTSIDPQAYFSESCTPSCIVNIPDVNFKNALLQSWQGVDTNNDGEIQCNEAINFTGSLYINSQNISDLSGIEAFVNVTGIIAYSNNISNVDLSQNLALTTLDLINNNLTNLNVTQNLALEILNIGGNSISVIDVSNNVALKELLVFSNSMSSLNITQNPNLKILDIAINNFSTVDLSQNLALTFLGCRDNNFTTIDVSNNTKLEHIYCGTNPLNNLDLSNNDSLKIIDCKFSDIQSLDLKNGFNTNITNIAVQNNPNLYCIQVDDSLYSTTNWVGSTFNFDVQTYFSESCTTPCIVNIPDANFKNYLINYSQINTNFDSEIQCSEASAFTGEIACFSQNISDLTGIEAFTALTSLKCGFNQISTLDLSSNTQLTYIDCRDNQISSIDVSTCLSLGDIRCNNNQLSNIDLTNNTALFNLACFNNSITSLDLSNNLALVSLGCLNNNITGSLDLSMHTSLETIHARNNDLSALNIANGNNVNMTTLVTEGNPNLSCIEVDDTVYSNANWISGNFQFDSLHYFSEDCNGSTLVLVTSINVQSQNGDSTITSAGGSLQMEATVLPINADDITYTWSVVNGTGSATIDANGLLTAVADGTVDVVATANDGSGVSGMKTIIISNQGTSVKDVAFEDLSIYPNPTSNLFTIQINDQLEKIELYNLAGQLIQSFDANERQFSMDNLPIGIYLLKLANADKQSVVKLVKN